MHVILLSLIFFIYLYIKLTKSKPRVITIIKNYIKCYLPSTIYAVLVTMALSFILVWRGRDIRNARIVMKCLKPLTRFNGIKIHLENEEILETSGRAVIISNHQSVLDIVGLIYAWPNVKNLITIASKRLIYMGSAGLIGYLIGTIFIDRKNPKQAYETIEKAAKIMKRNEVKIWIFPEGTRNTDDKLKLLPFKKGAFIMAVAAQAPIIPVVFSPQYFVDPKTYSIEHGGHIIMRCLEPVPTTGLTIEDVSELQVRLQNIVQHAIEQLSLDVFKKYQIDQSIYKK